VFAPYFLLTRFSFALYRLVSRQPAVAEVAPGLLLGRRLTAKEARQLGPVAVLDLAAEFGEAKTLREQDGYRLLPLLDATAPTREQLDSAVAWIAEQLVRGPVFVHCTLGQGRSACVVLAYLLHIGRVADVREGLKLLRRLRPGVGLSAGQRAMLTRTCLGHRNAG
jgi:protein-tyrosine phosphatase